MATRNGKKKIGRPAKHGAYSLIAKDDLLKDQPHIRNYLLDCRAGLVRDLGGEDHLTEQQCILIDRIISKLAICRLIEVYIEKYGAFRRDRLKQDHVLELEPALGKNYLGFTNSIERALVALGLNRKKVEEDFDHMKYIKEKYDTGEEYEK